MTYVSPIEEFTAAPVADPAPRRRTGNLTAHTSLAPEAEDGAAPIDAAGAADQDAVADLLLKGASGAVAGFVAPHVASGTADMGRRVADVLGLPGETRAERAALEKIAKALAADEITPQEARKRVVDAAPKMLSLLDSAGKNTVTLALSTRLGGGTQ